MTRIKLVSIKILAILNGCLQFSLGGWSRIIENNSFHWCFYLNESHAEFYHRILDFRWQWRMERFVREMKTASDIFYYDLFCRPRKFQRLNHDTVIWKLVMARSSIEYYFSEANQYIRTIRKLLLFSQILLPTSFSQIIYNQFIFHTSCSQKLIT